MSDAELSPKEFGEYLREQRLAHDMSLRSLAKMLKVSPTYISHIENGRADPPACELICCIADILSLDPNELQLKSGRWEEHVAAKLLTRPAFRKRVAEALSKTEDELDAQPVLPEDKDAIRRLGEVLKRNLWRMPRYPTTDVEQIAMYDLLKGFQEALIRLEQFSALVNERTKAYQMSLSQMACIASAIAHLDELCGYQPNAADIEALKTSMKPETVDDFLIEAHRLGLLPLSRGPIQNRPKFAAYLKSRTNQEDP